ncbi:MAG: hypothetical protein Q7P63_01285 [Verrucomicrobiota bacterium JB022]|nr:hypothetical protein [Verrucomicrobiota bacterium JB022]
MKEASELVSEKAGAALTDLLYVRWEEIVRAMEDMNRSDITVSASIKITRTNAGHNLKTKIAFASKTEDEREDRVDPPGQATIDFSREMEVEHV